MYIYIYTYIHIVYVNTHLIHLCLQKQRPRCSEDCSDRGGAMGAAGTGSDLATVRNGGPRGWFMVIYGYGDMANYG